MDSQFPLIFLSYSSPDRDRVLAFYELLRNHGHNAWIDCRKLLPGQIWDLEIKRAIDKAAMIFIFASEASVGRRGYFQRELKDALDRSKERLEDDIYIVPVLLDDIPIPASLKHLHAIFASDPECHSKIIASINRQLERESTFSWKSQIFHEAWTEGTGYEIEIELMDLHSSRFTRIYQASNYVRALIFDEANYFRATRLEQDSPHDESIATSLSNHLHAFCDAPKLYGSVLTITYTVGTYFTGAAHPNYYFVSFAFLLEPFIRISSLSSVFTDQDLALHRIQASVREQLMGNTTEPREPVAHDSGWIHRGTQSWDDFRCFEFGDESIEFRFAPYQVASYADGPKFAKVPYLSLIGILNPVIVAALEIKGPQS